MDDRLRENDYRFYTGICERGEIPLATDSVARSVRPLEKASAAAEAAPLARNTRWLTQLRRRRLRRSHQLFAYLDSEIEYVPVPQSNVA